MMKNIRKYCRENTFNCGVFLVGAAHWQPTIEKSKEQTANSTSIQWDFGDWLSQAVPPAWTQD